MEMGLGMLMGQRPKGLTIFLRVCFVVTQIRVTVLQRRRFHLLLRPLHFLKPRPLTLPLHLSCHTPSSFSPLPMIIQATMRKGSLVSVLTHFQGSQISILACLISYTLLIFMCYLCLCEVCKKGEEITTFGEETENLDRRCLRRPEAWEYVMLAL